MSLEYVLLYGGGAAVGLSAAAAILSVFIFKLKKERLRSQLEKEYGER